MSDKDRLPLNDDTLDRFLAGELDARDAARVQRGLEQTPLQRQLLGTLRGWLRQREVDEGMPAAMTSAAALRAKIHARSLGKSPAFRKHPLLPHGYRRWAGVVAIVLVGIVMAGQSLWMGRQGSSAPLAGNVTYTTRRLQVAHVTLPDGTRLTVAPNSTIQAAKDFSAHRYVVVVGEVYCDVTRANGTPFMIRAGNITARVLGTRFDVQHYPRDHAVRVAVVSGKIAITSTVPRQSARTLAAGLTAIATDSTILTSEGDVESLTNWTKGELTFHGTPVRDVLATVGHWYGYEFRVTDSTLARHPLSVRFQGDPADVVLRSLSLILNATLTYHGNVITVTPRHATQSLPKQHLRDTLLHPSMEVGR